MFIDPVEVAILAVASTIGAFGAALVLYLLTRLFNLERRAWATFIILVIGSMSGIAFLTERLAPYLATPLVHILPDPIYFERAMEDPLLGRLAEDHPELMAGLEARLIVAHFVGGVDLVRFEGERFGLQKSSAITADYFSRARTNDLVSIMNLQSEVFKDLARSNPDLCHPFLFGLGKSEIELAKRMDDAIPHELEAETRNLILAANDSVPDFDKALGKKILERAYLGVATRYGEEGLVIMTGKKKPGVPEERMLCDIYSGFFQEIAAEGDVSAAAAYRSMFSGVSG